MKNIISNKKHLYFICFFLFLFLVSNGLLAQTLSEKLGGVATDFVIISGEDTLDIDKQIIIKRAKYKAKKDYNTYETYEGGYGGYGYGFGYGYQSFHLEFTSKQQVGKTNVFNGNRTPTWYCTFHYYDKNGKQTLEMFVPGSMLKQGFNEQSVTSYIYSLNLVNVPILVLDNTSTIHIEWQYHTMKPKK